MVKVGAPVPQRQDRSSVDEEKDLDSLEPTKGGVIKSGGKRSYRNPTLTVDGIVVLDGQIVLIQRGRDPHQGKHALPGGIVEYGETVERAIVREMEEETGLKTEILDIVGIYSQPHRDPRGHFISICFLLRKLSGDLVGGDDAASAGLYPLDQLPPLAFDHADMIADYLEQRRLTG
jgi:8-oxo-dGTP diphosphatase